MMYDSMALRNRIFFLLNANASIRASLFIVKCLFYPLFNFMIRLEEFRPPPGGVFVYMLSLSSAIGTVLSKRCGFES